MNITKLSNAQLQRRESVRDRCLTESAHKAITPMDYKELRAEYKRFVGSGSFFSAACVAEMIFEMLDFMDIDNSTSPA